jgi:hypothetical protein
MVREFLHDRPALARGELAADAELVRDRSVALIVGGVPGVDRNLHCTVTSGRSCRRIASPRANTSRAACRASVRTNTRSGSSRRLLGAPRRVPRRGRQLHFSRDRIITPVSRCTVHVSISSAEHRSQSICGHHVIARSPAQPRRGQAREPVRDGAKRSGLTAPRTPDNLAS